MILILGVTASGKGRLAFDLAQSLDAEIISVDSMKCTANGYRMANLRKNTNEQASYADGRAE
jgi:tRNA A37 N6-isopentenylltransferase MiaA